MYESKKIKLNSLKYKYLINKPSNQPYTIYFQITEHSTKYFKIAKVADPTALLQSRSMTKCASKRCLHKTL